MQNSFYLALGYFVFSDWGLPMCWLSQSAFNNLKLCTKTVLLFPTPALVWNLHSCQAIIKFPWQRFNSQSWRVQALQRVSSFHIFLLWKFQQIIVEYCKLIFCLHFTFYCIQYHAKSICHIVQFSFLLYIHPLSFFSLDISLFLLDSEALRHLESLPFPERTTSAFLKNRTRQWWFYNV